MSLVPAMVGGNQGHGRQTVQEDGEAHGHGNGRVRVAERRRAKLIAFLADDLNG